MRNQKQWSLHRVQEEERARRCACTHTYTRTQMHVHTHAHTHAHKCTRAHTRTHTYTCTRTHKRARTHDLRARARYFTIWGGNQEGNSRACWLAPPTEACSKLRGTPLDGVLISQAEHRAKTARSGRIRVVALDSSGHRSRAKARPCGTTSCGPAGPPPAPGSSPRLRRHAASCPERRPCHYSGRRLDRDAVQLLWPDVQGQAGARAGSCRRRPAARAPAPLLLGLGLGCAPLPTPRRCAPTPARDSSSGPRPRPVCGRSKALLMPRLGPLDYGS